MVDFNKLKSNKEQSTIIEPLEVFRRLPKPLGINDLYTSQAEVLNEWFERRNEKDLAIKLHTGGGKTLVGLLLAQSVLNETKEPVIYLCPTNQLIEQTLAKAKEYGIPAVNYKKGEDLPRAFTSAESVLICSYNALFNAKSKFGIRGGQREIIKVGAIILDDAHIAYSTMRDAFTLEIRKETNEEDYTYLANIFRQDFLELGKLGTFDDILLRNEFAVIEVPYWAWRERSLQVREYLQNKADNYPFVWGFIRDSFDYCHCLISRDTFSLTPIFPNVDVIPTFSECPRRIYMSATISDDSMIVRSFNADSKSLAEPITSNSLAGVSERMILIPDLIPNIDIDTTFIKRFVSWLSQKRKKGTVILVSSKSAAKDWQDIGKVAESKEQVVEFISNLQQGKDSGPYIFANRYDGIDLPHDACRLLVMDGLPRGENDYDAFRSSIFLGGEEAKISLAQRIEQGIGRGARGGGDYCIVILTGYDLSAWLDRPINQGFLTSSSRSQLEMGKDISKEISSPKAFIETVDQCLNRDVSWTKYHAQTLAELVEGYEVNQKNQLDFASIERKSFELLRNNDFDSAINRITKFIESNDEIDKRTKGWLLQLKARIALYADNKDLAEKTQKDAFYSNENVHRPLNGCDYIPILIPQQQAKTIVTKFDEYSSKKGILAHFEHIAAWLAPAATSNQFEEALEKLGIILGFSTERPDKKYGKGPDVLWILNNEKAFVIEAKSKKLLQNPLDKYEHGQLLQADEWFKSNYPNYSSVRISFHPNREAKYEADTNETKVLTYDLLNELISSTRNLLRELGDLNISTEQLEIRCEELLPKYNLTHETFETKYLESFLSYSKS